MTILQIVTAMLVIIGFSTSLAHALEYPGKMKLDRPIYMQVQKIYYPGFTIAGLAEPLAIAASCIAAYLGQDARSFPFLAASAALVMASHAVYWRMTHPVNGFWLADETLGRAGQSFFGKGNPKRVDAGAADWVALRDRWERSHILRAILGGGAVVSLLCAIAR